MILLKLGQMFGSDCVDQTRMGFLRPVSSIQANTRRSARLAPFSARAARHFSTARDTAARSCSGPGSAGHTYTFTHIHAQNELIVFQQRSASPEFVTEGEIHHGTASKYVKDA